MEKTGEGLTNYKLLIQYEGTRYRGWQSQEGTEETIQGKLTRILERMTGDKVELKGAGRTDAGVHARGQVAHVRLRTVLSPQEIRDYLNRYLPEDIGVLKVTVVDNRFHSRLHAVGKTYVYRIWNSQVPNVFLRRFAAQVEEPLDVEAMRKAAARLVGTHDFLSFCTRRKIKKSTVRTVEEILIEELEGEIRLTYRGNGFLYHMVRILTGTLVEVGLHLRVPEEMEEIFQAKSRERAGRLMPGKGLILWSVEYADGAGEI